MGKLAVLLLITLFYFNSGKQYQVIQNRLIVGSILTRKDEIFIKIYLFISLLMPPEFGGKWETECLNCSIRLPIILCAGYSVKLI